MMTPMDRMLDAVEFTPLPPPEDGTEGLYATHRGTLDIMGCVFTVYVLNDGQRVIDAREIERFLNAEGK